VDARRGEDVLRFIASFAEDDDDDDDIYLIRGV
jgi:hypothetical protein